MAAARRAFTLVEMLIVVAILAVLMSIMFKLGNLGQEDKYRADTVVRLQKIENCLSGYYAAFGSYPPVAVHGYRDIDCSVDRNGDQTSSGGGGQANQKADGESLVWAQVEAACRSQPFGCEYPGNRIENEMVKTWSDDMKERVNGSDYPEYKKSSYSEVMSAGFIGVENLNGFPSEKNNPDWKAIKLFKFGVMSFLLPRYLFMMSCAINESGGVNSAMETVFEYAQWQGFNDLPCDPFEGQMFDDWRDILQYVGNGQKENPSQKDLARVANIPTQAVCARWIPNLEGICSSITRKCFFGVYVTPNYGEYSGLELWDTPTNPNVHTSPSGEARKLAFVTVNDAWGRELYYYSPAPYQTYTLWSAGSNGKTFPPWVPLDELQTKERETALEWKQDDIMQMSH